MIFCTNCGKQLEDDSLFCPDCGTAVTKPVQPQEVQEVAAAPEQAPAFEPVATPAPTQVPTQAPAQAPNPAYEAPVNPKKKAKSGSKIGLIIGGIAAAVVVLILIIVLVCSIFGAKEVPQNDRVFYVKDDANLYMSVFNKKQPVQVSKEFFDGDFDNNDIDYAYVEFKPTLLSDNKTLIYPDKIDEEGAYTLYVRNVKNLKKDPIKIGENISRVVMPESEKFILYKEDGNLYKHNFTEKEKIASDVSEYTMSKDGKVIYFIDDENKLYIKSGDKDKVKIASDVESICYVNSKYNTVYFSEKGDNGRYIYFSKNGKEKVKYASDVMELHAMYDSGDAYYTKYDKNDGYILYYNDGNEEVKIIENVASVTKYDKSAKIVIKAYENSDNDDTIIYFASEEHLTQLDAENAKRIKFSDDGKSLYYLNDYDEDDNIGDLIKVNVSGNTPRRSEVLDGDVNDYELDGNICYYEKDTEYDDNDYESFTLCIDGKEVAKEVNGIAHLNYSESKLLLYYSDINDDGTTATLYVYNGRKSEVVDTDVYIDYFGCDEDNKSIYYFVDYNEKDSDGTLKFYKGGKASVIAHDVYDYSMIDGKKLVYETDYDEENYTTTLMYFDGRKSKSLCEDVYSYKIVEDGKVYILGDYNNDKSKGDLYLAKNGKAQEIDEDVVKFIYYNNYKQEVYLKEEFSEYYPDYYTNFFHDSYYSYDSYNDYDDYDDYDDDYYDDYYDDYDYYY